MGKVNQTLKKLCKMVKILKDQSNSLLQLQGCSTDVGYVKAQENIRDAAGNIIKIMENILKETDKKC